jgi:hypothetical protein
MNVFRDPPENEFINLEMEDYGPLVNYTPGYLQHHNSGPFNTAIDVLADFLARTAAANQGRNVAESARQNL